MLVETFVAGPSVEGFDVGALFEFAWLDPAQGHSPFASPCHHRLSREFSTVVDSDDLRQSPLMGQSAQHLGAFSAGYGALHFDGNGFTSCVVDDG